MRRCVALTLLAALGCGGGTDDPEPASAPDTAGAEAPPEAPAGPAPEAVAEVRDLVQAIGLGPTEAAAARLRGAAYRSAEVEPVRTACLALVEAFVAGSVEAFDADAQCFTRVEGLRTSHGVTEAPDVAPFHALVAESRAARQGDLPPLPPGFATDTDERTFTGEITDADPTLENGAGYDEHAIELTAGWTITVDLVAAGYDAYLYLHGEGGQLLAENDDGGEGLNSRLVHRVDVPGRYLLRASTYSAGARGTYRLTVALSRD